MALKDKLRRAMGRSSDVSSSDSDSTPSTRPATGTTTPSEATSSIDYNTHPLGPSMTFTPAPLQKSASALRLTRTLTFLGSSSSNGTKLTSQEKKEAKALKAWRKEDEEEWRAPKSIRPSKRKDKACQDKLRAFHLNASGHLDAYGRNRSVCSGVSPCASQRPSAELHRVLTGERKDVSGAGAGGGPDFGSISLAIRAAGGSSISKAADVDSEDRPTVTHLQNVGTAPVVASH